VGNIGGPELLVVLIVALLVLGPNRLPQAARQMGKAMAEFRRVTGGLQAEVRDAMSQLENEVSSLPLEGPPANPPMPEPPQRPQQLPGPSDSENA
jgi:sec-independent protein translocase protein TatB